MKTFLYDHTFEGFLSAVYYAYDSKIIPDKIVGKELYQDELFAEKIHVHTNYREAERVWNGIEKKLSKQIGRKVYRVFLSEMDGVEKLIFKYLQLGFKGPAGFDTNYGNKTVLEFNNVYKKVCMEGHRAIMFIRFQKTVDGIFYAPFEPKYDVLPLTINHFKDRFSDQQWVVYDTKRNYGFYYDLTDVNKIIIFDSQIDPFTGKVNKNALHPQELDFQKLWKDYYQSANIKERKNLKVHQQFLPKRFWKYLPEKNFVK